MNKFLLTLACFLGVLLIPLKVQAEFLPPVLPDLQAVPDFLMMAGQYQMTNDTRTIIERSDYDKLNQLINGRTISQSMSNHYVDNANIGQLQLFYDQNGNLINQDNTYTVFGTSDIIDYACVCDKTTGQILYSLDSNNRLYSTLTAGDVGFSDLFNDTSTTVGREMYNFALGYAKQNGMVVYSNLATEEEIEQLESYEYYAVWHTNEMGWTCYVPNACTEDTVVICEDGAYQAQTRLDIESDNFWYFIWAYTNDPSSVVFSQGKNSFLDSGSFNFGEYYFNFATHERGHGYNIFYYGGYIHGRFPTYAEYQQHRHDADNAVYIQPSENTGNVTNIYNYTYTTPIQPSPIYNNNYDYSTKTTYNNYPISNTYNFSETNPTTNNYYQDIYNYITSPNDDESAGTLNPSELTDNIPILSNLKYRFPFSIPFDLFNLFKSFSVPRETPVITGDIEFGNFYVYHVNIDLSQFNDLAGIARNLFLISFIIGLCYFSYNHFFGT